MRAVSITKTKLATNAAASNDAAIGTINSIESHVTNSTVNTATSTEKTGIVQRWVKQAVLRWLEHLSIGYLLVKDSHEEYHFGDRTSALRATVTIHAPIAYRDILFNGLVGTGEAYMRGAWTTDDLVSAVRILCANINVMQSLNNNIWSKINHAAASVIHRLWRSNTADNARLNIAAHYDLGNDFFHLFLDPTMMYSSAIYPTKTSTLDEASTYKLEHICQSLQLCVDDHLLEIGTGWGGMAIYAATHYGCRVTTTTISKEQHHYAVEKVKAAGLEGKITVLLDDYRDLAHESSGRFDKLVSIEMIEAVGHRFYQQYFNTCAGLLKDDGLMLVQAITVPDQRYEVTKNSTDFIQRYIFPGGELPSINVMSSHITRDTDMQIVSIDDITLDYAKTLAAWREKFFERLDDVKAQGFDDVFIRMWDFYLSYCEGGFRERTISTVQLLMAKPRCLSLPKVAR